MNTFQRKVCQITLSNPFDLITEFEQALAEYTGAKYAVMTDCCTHALELCFRIAPVTYTEFTPRTYISIPMMLMKLGIKFRYNKQEAWSGQYYFSGTGIWDSARALYPNMYKSGQLQCLSFGYNKPLQLGRGGAILLDDKDRYEKLKRMCYDGRDLSITPWQEQQEFELGYHYKPTPEEAELGLKLLGSHDSLPKYHEYPDLRKLTIKTSTS